MRVVLEMKTKHRNISKIQCDPCWEASGGLGLPPCQCTSAIKEPESLKFQDAVPYQVPCHQLPSSPVALIS